MEKIKLLDVTLEELEIIVESLEATYQKKLKKAQRTSGNRIYKMEEQLRVCQTILQEMLAIAHYAKRKLEIGDSAGSAILQGEESGTAKVDL